MEFNNQRGCYLWTHKKSSKQYIGSSINLSLRLSEYFRPGYLKLQSKRGSAIARAIIKYGLDQFSISIMVLGPSPEKYTNYYSNNLPDFVVMEQSYLDNYELVYNINRVASSNYEPSTASVNEGEDNPSYGLKGEQAFVWDKTHTDKLKSKWSATRGKYTFYVYSSSMESFDLIKSFPSASKLSSYLKVSLNLGAELAKLIKAS